MNSDIVVAVLKNDTMSLANQEVTIKQTKSSYSSAQPRSIRSSPRAGA